MKNDSHEAIQSALKVIDSSIDKCEKIQPKFSEGTSQFSLLRNRIKALKISKCLIEEDESIQVYTLEDLEKALPPVISIISKTRKAQSKYEEGSSQFKRFSPLIEAMVIAEVLINQEIGERNL